MIFPVLAGLSVAAFFLFAALWVNGNFPVPVAVSIAALLGVSIFADTARRSARTPN